MKGMLPKLFGKAPLTHQDLEGELERACEDYFRNENVQVDFWSESGAPAGIARAMIEDVPAITALAGLEVLRKHGWMVAVHNDYVLGDKLMTFWMFVRGELAVRGEGETDAEAIGRVIRNIGLENITGEPVPIRMDEEERIVLLDLLARENRRLDGELSVTKAHASRSADLARQEKVRQIARILSRRPRNQNPS